MPRALVLYATDLSPRSEIAPGGVTNTVRSCLEHLPVDWEVDLWGAVTSGADTGARPMMVGSRRVWFRPIVEAAPVTRRRVPLSLGYCLALANLHRRGEISASRYDLVVAHRTDYVASLRTPLSRRQLPPVLAVIHGSSAFAPRVMGLAKRWLYLVGERAAVKMARRVALVSRSALSYYRALYRETPGHRFTWLPNAVDQAVFSPGDRVAARESLNVPLDAQVFMYHGRLEREKGIDRLVSTMRRIAETNPKAHFFVAGAGMLDRWTAEQASVPPLAGRVRLFGFRAPHEVAALLQASDVSLLCSRFEGMSVGLLESLACGVPVVATDVGDNRLLLSMVDADLVVPPDPCAIAQRATQAATMRQALTSRAVRVAGEFSVQRRARRVAHLWSALDAHQGTF
jgi:glycosyltransferase involved in cell wall biosynthesis